MYQMGFYNNEWKYFYVSNFVFKKHTKEYYEVHDLINFSIFLLWLFWA